MNVALPALVVFIILLPGFIFRTRLKRAERTSLDYSPFGQVVAEAVLWAVLAHLLWLSGSAWLFKCRFEPEVLIKLLSASPVAQVEASERVGRDFGDISKYFVSLMFAAYLIPKGLRWTISRWRLDRDAARFSSFFRFHGAPWYYLLTGADFKKNEEPDLIVISAIVDVAGQPVLYVGVLDEFFVNSDGELDRLVLQEVMRRPIAEDKATSGDATVPRFYDIDGDYFVLRYAETITLNVQYVKLTESETLKGMAETNIIISNGGS